MLIDQTVFDDIFEKELNGYAPLTYRAFLTILDTKFFTTRMFNSTEEFGPYEIYNIWLSVNGLLIQIDDPLLYPYPRSLWFQWTVDKKHYQIFTPPHSDVLNIIDE